MAACPHAFLRARRYPRWHKAIRVCRPQGREFVTVLADQNVKTGETITLCCEVNTDDVEVTWKKDDQTLRCVEGKHTVSKTNKKCTLEITNAQPSDEGKYTINIENKTGSDSCSAIVRVEIKPWRDVTWDQNKMFAKLEEFKICEKVPELRFLMVGPVGAGKSSSINTIKSVFEKRQFINCLGATSSETSLTLSFQRFGIPNKDRFFPFAFNKVMGLQQSGGGRTVDIINAMKGHIKEGYQFNPTFPLSDDSKYYNRNPSLSDQIHCLIYVIPAEKIMMMPTEVTTKTKAIREEASKMGLPQVVFLTKIDCICPLTKEDLQKVYMSKKIRDRIHECSNIVGVPANNIFPLINYSKETHINEKINCLMMDALIQIINWANDYVKAKTETRA
ncbi:interferon-induced protein 44-like [Trichomycterus rosablanca]|uniref:interferon-induced protein 44-like n=1 Tax=Trichomycterus rosablanca TaxID=2290929 RepID=UPI002F359883